MGILSKLLGNANENYLKKKKAVIEKINSLEEKFEKFSDKDLKDKTADFKERLSKGESLNDLLPEAFALVREASKRTLKQRHYDVQLIGGIVLHEGKIAEMKTGEGKTLSATLALYLNSLEGKGCHLVTVNDYLAKRDAVWMGQIYDALDLSVGCIVNEKAYLYDPEFKNKNEDDLRDKVGGFKVVENYLRDCSRKEAYEADITYGTNNEFAFDYLRDNMIYDLSQEVQRGFHYAIVDEVDSILIDEARTPLIISGRAEESTEKYYRFAKLVSNLKENEDYSVDEKMKAVVFTEEGQEKIVQRLGFDPWAENDITTCYQLEAALKAKTLFHKDKDYVVRDGKVVIVDEFTGRLMPGRRWSGGLHQAIEAKEREVGGHRDVQVKEESQTLAVITFQNYFRFYKKLAGMTGTALTSAEEFYKVYGLDVISVPTHNPMIRKDLPDKIYKTEEGKFKAVVREIKEINERGQPILVGTRSVERSEYLGRLLQREGISHQILNAKNHQREGEIIAQAGKFKAVTIATNMAGRGVDIILGGNPPNLEEQRKVKELGGLYVIGTERHEARRIDNQLRGRSGRQGDPGISQFFVSLEDELMRIFGGDRIKRLMGIMKIQDDEAIQSKMVSSVIESAQSKIEGFNFDARNHVLEYDDVMSKQREVIYKKRKDFLKAGCLKEKILEILEKEIKKIVDFHTQGDYQQEWNKKEIFEIIKNIFPLNNNEIWKELEGIDSKDDILKYLIKLSKEAYEVKEREEGKENMRKLEKLVSLKVLDLFWVNYLSNLDYLRDSVRLRVYGGKDPLVEYKSEARKMFQQLLEDVDFGIINSLFKSNFVLMNNLYNDSRNVYNRLNQKITGKIGRNDYCPCGSGKKYKRCHGA